MSQAFARPIEIAATLLMFLLLAGTSLTGCNGRNRAPDPTSRGVRNLVLSTSLNAIRSAMLPEVASDETGMTADAMLRCGYPEFRFRTWARMREESEEIARVVSELEERTKDLDLRLENVRIESKEEDLRRVVCRAQLLLGNGNTMDIRYLAQYTEDGRLYVQVELLD